MDTLVSFGLRLLAMLPGVLQRWYWTEERLSAAIEIDMRGTGEALKFNLSAPARVELWLKITSMAPFDITIDRLKIELWSNGYIGEIWGLEKHTLQPRKSKDIFIKNCQCFNSGEGSGLDQEHVNCELQVGGYFISKVRQFTKSPVTLSMVHGKVINRGHR